jgi:transposase
MVFTFRMPARPHLSASPGWGQVRDDQDLATMLRCHVTAFKAFGGAARAILYDHMKTAETGEGDRDGSV